MSNKKPGVEINIVKTIEMHGDYLHYYAQHEVFFIVTKGVKESTHDKGFEANISLIAI